MNTITLTGLKTVMGDTLCSFECRTGMCNVGIGRFLIQKPTSNPNSVTINLKGNTTDKSIATKAAAIIPASVNYNIANAAYDIYEIILYDVKDDNTRFKKLINKRYNCLDATTGTFDLTTYKTPSSFTEWTWANIFTDLEITVDGAITLPTWNPRNLILNNLPKNIAIDKIAAELQLVVGWNYETDDPCLYEVGQLSTANGTIMTSASDYIINKPALTKTKRYDTRLPATIKVLFPIFRYGGMYGVDITVSATGSGTLITHCSNIFAERDTAGTFSNLTDLTAVATDIATRLYNRLSADVNEIEYIGIWPFNLDGQIRSIKWIVDKDGARTIIGIDNLNDYEIFCKNKKLQGSYQHQYDGLDNLDIVGMASGSSLIIPAIPRIKYAQVYTADDLENGFTSSVEAYPMNIGNTGGTNGVNIDTSYTLHLKVTPKASSVGITCVYGDVVGYIPFVNNLERDDTLSSTLLYDGLVISGAGETGLLTGIVPGTEDYQILEWDNTNKLWKPGRVRAY